MNKERYEHLCLEAEAGREAFATHPGTREEGMVTQCILQTGHLVVETPTGHKRCWDYRDCEELTHPKSGPMI